jgi:hypothetical protein
MPMPDVVANAVAPSGRIISTEHALSAKFLLVTWFE